MVYDKLLLDWKRASGLVWMDTTLGETVFCQGYLKLPGRLTISVFDILNNYTTKNTFDSKSLPGSWAWNVIWPEIIQNLCEVSMPIGKSHFIYSNKKEKKQILLPDTKSFSEFNEETGYM